MKVQLKLVLGICSPVSQIRTSIAPVATASSSISNRSTWTRPVNSQESSTWSTWPAARRCRWVSSWIYLLCLINSKRKKRNDLVTDAVTQATTGTNYDRLKRTACFRITVVLADCFVYKGNKSLLDVALLGIDLL